MEKLEKFYLWITQIKIVDKSVYNLWISVIRTIGIEQLELLILVGLWLVVIVVSIVRLAFVCIIYNLWITRVKIVDKYAMQY